MTRDGAVFYPVVRDVRIGRHTENSTRIKQEKDLGGLLSLFL